MSHIKNKTNDFTSSKKVRKIVELLGNKKLTGWEITNFSFKKIRRFELKTFQETLAHLKYLENKKVLNTIFKNIIPGKLLKGLKPLFLLHEYYQSKSLNRIIYD